MEYERHHPLRLTLLWKALAIVGVSLVLSLPAQAEPFNNLVIGKKYRFKNLIGWVDCWLIDVDVSRGSDPVRVQFSDGDKLWTYAGQIMNDYNEPFDPPLPPPRAVSSPPRPKIEIKPPKIEIKPPSSPQGPSASSRSDTAFPSELLVENRCPKDIEIGMVYKSMSGWEQSGLVWNIRATSTQKLLAGGWPVKVYNPVVYYEARSKDGQITWAGSHAINFGERTLRAKERVFDPGTEYRLSITCN